MIGSVVIIFCFLNLDVTFRFGGFLKYENNGRQKAKTEQNWT